MLRTRRVGGRTSFLSAQGYPLIAAWLVDYARVDRVLRQSYNLVNRILVIEREFYKRQETRTDVPANLWARLIVEGQFSWKPWTIKSTAYVVQLAPHTTGYELPGLGVLVDCSRLSLPLPSIGKIGTHFRCYLSSLVSCQNSSSGLGGEVKGRRWSQIWEASLHTRQGSGDTCLSLLDCSNRRSRFRIPSSLDSSSKQYSGISGF